MQSGFGELKYVRGRATCMTAPKQRAACARFFARIDLGEDVVT
jgi:hypothetical protein